MSGAAGPATTTTARTADVAIVGLGAMGSAVALELARRGVRVVGFDADSMPNARSSHHGGTRVIRLAYAEHPDYVPLLRRAFARWTALQDMLEEPILDLFGGLYMGPADGPFVTGVRRAVEVHGLAHELLDSEDLRRRFSQLRLPEGTIGVLERQAGALRCERIVAGQARLAAAAGAELHGHCRVERWGRLGPGPNDGFELETPIGRWTADRVLLAAGPWAGQLLPDLGTSLRTTRQLVGWFAPRRSARFTPASLPLWGLEHPGGGFEYGFPTLPERPGVKYGLHALGTDADPDSMPRTVTADERTALSAGFAERIDGGADAPLISMQACLYTSTPDGHPVVGLHPDDDRLAVAAGFSGHGFKFASVLGEALADLLTRGTTPLPIGFLDPARFTRNDAPA